MDVCKSYRLGPVEVPVLRGVRLEVARGDLLSIMGPSGCGKSTLMSILGLLDRPTSGVYRLNGREIGGESDREVSQVRNADIGFVFQSFHLLPRMTAGENVGLPLVYRSMPQGRVRERAREALERVGMGDRVDHRPSQLSGGQQQRVALARALVGEPSLILADEPTGALDPGTGREIMDLLDGLSTGQGITVIIVTHDPAVSRRCTRRARMHAGVLSEDGSVPAGANGG